MKEELVVYFVGEKRGALILLAAGITALAAAIALLATRSIYRGMALPLAALALFELVIGAVVFARTDAQVLRLMDQFALAPAEMARAELFRMGPVMRNFGIVIIAEVVILTAGVLLTRLARSDFLSALGVGCIAQAGLLLVVDLMARQRAVVYVAALRALT